jgi:transcriptional regulator with XRE-family HTH domain
MRDRNQIIAHVLDTVPGSLREIAREAGVSHTLLSHVRSRKRNPTPALLRALMKALDGWGEECRAGSAKLEQLIEEDE